MQVFVAKTDINSCVCITNNRDQFLCIVCTNQTTNSVEDASLIVLLFRGAERIERMIVSYPQTRTRESFTSQVVV